MMEMPPLEHDDEGLDLSWHAMNYRTAHTLHAKAMWRELKRYVENWGELCARMAREQERERCIQACKGEEVDADGSQHREDVAYNTGIEHCIEAIRKG